MRTVYLAGGMSNLGFEEADRWRQEAVRTLEPFGLQCLSPMRFKPYLKTEGKIDRNTHLRGSGAWSTDAGLTDRDRRDCTTSACVLMNLMGAERASIGSMIEVGWADAHRVPLIVAMEAGGKHDHPMVRRIASAVLPTIEEATQAVLELLCTPLELRLAEVRAKVAKQLVEKIGPERQAAQLRLFD